MTKPWSVVLGSAAVIVAGTVFLVSRSTEEPAVEESAPAAGARPQRPTTPSTSVATPAQPLSTSSAAAGQPAPSEPADEEWVKPDPPPPTGPWESIRPVSRFEALGRIGPGVRSALADLKDRRIEQCFDGPPVNPEQRRAMDEEQGPVPDTTPVLLLELETIDKAVRIGDVKVQTRGSASPRVLDCAIGALEGATLSVPQAVAGGRHRLLYRLAPDEPGSTSARLQ